jgi:hemolysin activation/secretion protein
LLLYQENFMQGNSVSQQILTTLSAFLLMLQIGYDKAAATTVTLEFPLRTVRLLDNRLLSEGEIQAAAAPYLDQVVGLPELLEIRFRLQQLIQEKGYITTQVTFVTGEDLAEGAVTYRVVEGRLGEIRVEGLEHLQPQYVRQRLSPCAEPPLNVNCLQENLQLLSQDPLFEQVRANLDNSQQLVSPLTVTLKEAPRFRLAVETNNAENPAVGEWGGLVEATERNLVGWGDALQFAAKWTEGLQRYTAAYQVPVTPQDTVAVFSQGTEVRIVTRPFEALGIRNSAYTLGADYTRHLWRSPGEEFNLGLTLERRESRSFLFEDIPFPFSANTPDEGVQLTVLRFYQEYIARSPASFLRLTSQFSSGWSNLLADADFFKWDSRLQYIQQLGDNTQFLFRLALQLSPDRLAPVEQCAIGGITNQGILFENAVRGYPTNFRLGDSCAAAAAEVRFTLLDASDWGQVQLYPFLDFGMVWNSGGATPELNTLLSTGVGLRWQLGESLLLEVNYGIPLSRTERGLTSSWQDQGLNFRFQLGTSF